MCTVYDEGRCAKFFTTDIKQIIEGKETEKREGREVKEMGKRNKEGRVNHRVHVEWQ